MEDTSFLSPGTIGEDSLLNILCPSTGARRRSRRPRRLGSLVEGVFREAVFRLFEILVVPRTVFSSYGIVSKGMNVALSFHFYLFQSFLVKRANLLSCVGRGGTGFLRKNDPQFPVVQTSLLWPFP